MPDVKLTRKSPIIYYEYRNRFGIQKDTVNPATVYLEEETANKHDFKKLQKKVNSNKDLFVYICNHGSKYYKSIFRVIEIVKIVETITVHSEYKIKFTYYKLDIFNFKIKVRVDDKILYFRRDAFYENLAAIQQNVIKIDDIKITAKDFIGRNIKMGDILFYGKNERAALGKVIKISNKGTVYISNIKSSSLSPILRLYEPHYHAIILDDPTIPVLMS